MRCVTRGLPLYRSLRDGGCYYCRKKAKEAQADLDEWVAAE